jgi:catechol 2,3-dioxygenase
MTMKVRSLGHVVIKVRDQQRAEAFYGGLLGIPIAARYAPSSMTFFTLGSHHDFAILAVGENAAGQAEKGVGLFHVAFNIGDSLDELREAKRKLETAGVQVEAFDHIVTKSIYFKDPDGNTIELFIDSSDAWKQDPQLVANIAPMEL